MQKGRPWQAAQSQFQQCSQSPLILPQANKLRQKIFNGGALLGCFFFSPRLQRLSRALPTVPRNDGHTGSRRGDPHIPTVGAPNAVNG
jgi:hypothetical protein